MSNQAKITCTNVWKLFGPDEKRIIKGLDKKLTNYRIRKNSLSSNIFVSIINGYRVYRCYMKMGYLESLYRLLILSSNFLKKKLINYI